MCFKQRKNLIANNEKELVGLSLHLIIDDKSLDVNLTEESVNKLEKN